MSTTIIIGNTTGLILSYLIKWLINIKDNNSGESSFLTGDEF
jgi:hypothetical protein